MNYVPIIFILVLWVIYYIFRVIWFTSHYISLKKYLLILILEDNFIAAGIILIYMSISKYIYKGYMNLIYCLLLTIFLIPSIVVQYILEKNKI